MVGSQTERHKPMNETTGILALVVIIGSIALAVAAILMPFVVMAINSKCAKIEKTLAKMEHLMRFGK